MWHKYVCFRLLDHYPLRDKLQHLAVFIYSSILLRLLRWKLWLSWTTPVLCNVLSMWLLYYENILMAGRKKACYSLWSTGGIEMSVKLHLHTFLCFFIAVIQISAIFLDMKQCNILTCCQISLFPFTGCSVYIEQVVKHASVRQQ